LLLGDYKQAASSAKEGLVEDPDSLPLLLLHLKAQVELGELDQAQYVLAYALRLAPHNLELQSLADSLDLQIDQRSEAPPAVSLPPAQTIPDVPAHARDDWKTAKDWRSGKPLFNEADASAIKRAFKAHKPTLANTSRVPSRNFSFLPPIGFLLLCMALTGYWLWSHMGK
jgi:tetratricopeptide (TPR) repeat protein